MEFYGIMIGDGSLYHSKNCKYFFSIAEGDYEYTLHISRLIEKIIGKRPKIKYRSKAYRIEFKSKQLFNIFKQLGFPTGKKSSIITIPRELVKNEYVNMLIRGIFDTDGTIFYTRKPGIEEYPTIEITSKSVALLYQVKSILVRNYGINSHIRKSDKACKLAVYGVTQVSKWIKYISSSHKRKYWLLARVIRRS